jgi:hypothetical protein
MLMFIAIIILIAIAFSVGWACGEPSGYNRCVRDYKEISDKVGEKDLPLFINS